jgi:serine/threonine-protein kinase
MGSYFKRKKKIPMVVAIFVITQVCDAVGYAHSQSVLHGNLNPMNILITHEGLIKVKEFSFFNNLSSSTNVKALNFKQFRYIAPENFRSNQLLPESDVYSLAVILYEMLTGKPPFEAENTLQLIHAIVSEQPKPPSHHNPEVPKWLDHIVMRCLEKRKEDRWRSIDVILEKIQENISQETT